MDQTQHTGDIPVSVTSVKLSPNVCRFAPPQAMHDRGISHLSPSEFQRMQVRPEFTSILS